MILLRSMWTTVFRAFMSFLKDTRSYSFNFIIVIYTIFVSICILLQQNAQRKIFRIFIHNECSFCFVFLTFPFHSILTDDQFKFYNIIHLFCLMVVPKNKIKRREFCCIELDWRISRYFCVIRKSRQTAHPIRHYNFPFSLLTFFWASSFTHFWILK